MATITYENEPCSRCGGSGNYSYNQITGTRCFKCGGAGTQLTKRGKATRDFLAAMLTVPATEIVIGDRVRNIDHFAGKRFTFTVAKIERASYSQRITADGGREPIWHLDMTSVDGRVHSFHEGSEVTKVPTAEQIEMAREYQDNLTKAGKPRKRRA